MWLRPHLLGFAVLLAACSGGEEKVKVGESLGTEAFPQAMPTGGKVIDAAHGEETWLAYGPVAGVPGVPSNGVITSHLFQDGTYIFTAQVNIAMAGEGTFYEVWLRDSASGEQVSAGHLLSHFGDVRHFLKFETQRDLKSFTVVSITREVDDGNPAPSGNQVAQGALKETKR